MNPHKDNMAVLGQLVKLIPRKIIETLRKKHKIQTRSFSATSHQEYLNQALDIVRFFDRYIVTIWLSMRYYSVCRICLEYHHSK